jgi:hypothetical protein
MPGMTLFQPLLNALEYPIVNATDVLDKIQKNVDHIGRIMPVRNNSKIGVDVGRGPPVA